MRRIARAIITICLAVMACVLNVTPVLAALSVDVTVTWTPAGALFPPTDFVATVIDNDTIRLTWIPDVMAVTTHIRGKVGSYPVNVLDGYEVYNGAGNTVDDNSVNLDETAANIYYIAYSVDGGGVHSINYAQANAGGTGMTMIAFFGGALIMTWIGMSNRTYGILKFLSGVFWFAVLAYWLNGLRPAAITAGSPADQIIILFLFGIGLAVMLMPWWYDKDKNGKDTRGRFRLPFSDDDEDEMPERYAPTRQERSVAYSTRVNGALNGNRQRR